MTSWLNIDPLNKELAKTELFNFNREAVHVLDASIKSEITSTVEIDWI